jgi:hypothetical protein
MKIVVKLEDLRKRASFYDLQIVVFSEIGHEIPCHGIGSAQVTIDNNTFNFAIRGRDGSGKAPSRIAQMAAWLGATRAKLAHHTRQALGPIAGSKNLPIMCDALDE